MTRTHTEHVTHRPAVVDVRHPEGPLAASLCPRVGGELSSLTLENRANDGGKPIELLYRGNDFTPPAEGWRGRAPWLWPAAGRCYHDDDIARAGAPDFDRDACSWRCAGRKLAMRHHGFAKDIDWRTESTGDDAHARLCAAPDGGHHDIYPFEFALQSHAIASPRGVELSFRVDADPANTAPMPFQLGLHLTFDFARWWGASWLNGTVEGLGDHAYDVDAVMQPTRRVALPANGARFHEAAVANAIVPAGAEPAVRLVAPDGTAALSMRFMSQPAFGADDAVWVTHLDPQHRFFCCEPWIGWPNALNSGRGCVRLDPGATWSWALQLSLD